MQEIPYGFDRLSRSCGELKVTGNEWLVVCCIRSYRDKDGKAWPSQETISLKTGLSCKQVKTAVRGLKQKGLLAVTPRQRTSAIYDISPFIQRALPFTIDRVGQLRLMPYVEYLKTPEWAEKRVQKLKEMDGLCQICNGTKGGMNVHHRTYERLGEELMGDLTVLCRRCHSLFHEGGRMPVRNGGRR